MPPDETPKDESATVEPTPEPIAEPSKEEKPEVQTPEVEVLKVEIPEIQETSAVVEEPTLEEPPAPPEPETTTTPATKPKEPEPITEPVIEKTPTAKPASKEPITNRQSSVTDSVPPPIAPTPSHITDEQVKRDKPVAPAKHDPKYTKGVPKKVLELTDEEIEAARKLWAREHIADAQKQSNVNRKIHMNKMLDGIEAVVKNNPQTTTHAVANDIGISEKSASGYLQKLVKAGRINASGNSRNRRYYK
jgi:hypothetical protein